MASTVPTAMHWIDIFSIESTVHKNELKVLWNRQLCKAVTMTDSMILAHAFKRHIVKHEYNFLISIWLKLPMSHHRVLERLNALSDSERDEPGVVKAEELTDSEDGQAQGTRSKPSDPEDLRKIWARKLKGYMCECCRKKRAGSESCFAYFCGVGFNDLVKFHCQFLQMGKLDQDRLATWLFFNLLTRCWVYCRQFCESVWSEQNAFESSRSCEH